MSRTGRENVCAVDVDTRFRSFVVVMSVGAIFWRNIWPHDSEALWKAFTLIQWFHFYDGCKDLWAKEIRRGKKLEVVKTSNGQKFINLWYIHKMEYYVAIKNDVFGKGLHSFLEKAK